jgi:hypothetical protein
MSLIKQNSENFGLGTLVPRLDTLRILCESNLSRESAKKIQKNGISKDSIGTKTLKKTLLFF